MIDYRNYFIEPKRDFGTRGFLIEGRWIKVGYVVTKGGCNAMPGAVWFRSIEEAKVAIDVLIETDGRGIWSRTDGTRLASVERKAP